MFYFLSYPSSLSPKELNHKHIPIKILVTNYCAENENNDAGKKKFEVMSCIYFVGILSERRVWLAGTLKSNLLYCFGLCDLCGWGGWCGVYIGSLLYTG